MKALFPDNSGERAFKSLKYNEFLIHADINNNQKDVVVMFARRLFQEIV
jgi:hypothetical protein